MATVPWHTSTSQISLTLTKYNTLFERVKPAMNLNFKVKVSLPIFRRSWRNKKGKPCVETMASLPYVSTFVCLSVCLSVLDLINHLSDRYKMPFTSLLQKPTQQLWVSRKSAECQFYFPHWCNLISSDISHTYLTTCMKCHITPCYRIHPEKLTRLKHLKKFPAFYGTRSFVTAFTTALHLSRSSARSIQSMPSPPTIQL